MEINFIAPLRSSLFRAIRNMHIIHQHKVKQKFRTKIYLEYIFRYDKVIGITDVADSTSMDGNMDFIINVLIENVGI